MADNPNSPPSAAKTLLRRYIDPAHLHLLEVLEMAIQSHAPPEVIEGIQKVLHYVDLREAFSLDSTTEDSVTCRKVAQDTLTTDWTQLHQQGLTSSILSPLMLSGHLEGQFLKSLLSTQRARRVLDVGMYTGYSALSMAEALPADGELVTLDREPYLKERNQAIFDAAPHGKKISIRIGNALETMKELLENKKQFDFIFLDANKSEYIDYLKLCFDEGLLAENGTVAVDNAYMLGRNYLPTDLPPDGSRKFAQHVKADRRLHKVLVPVRDGVLIIRRLSDVERDFPH